MNKLYIWIPKEEPSYLCKSCEILSKTEGEREYGRTEFVSDPLIRAKREMVSTFSITRG